MSTIAAPTMAAASTMAIPMYRPVLLLPPGARLGAGCAEAAKPPPSGEAIPSGEAMPSGGATPICAIAAASFLVAAAVSAFRSIRPESSRAADELIGREEGRAEAAIGLEADVSALSENSTDDSLRAPVLEPAAGAAAG